ncbi:DUF4876 domain-containing protein [Pedobacter insulae]|uniref:DUF4876 domain-containing protein n=1 Tax=Pedobacter insulae TaxID=414048 RepID=A0A1I2YME7_9SPHI|nr:DUF4876 domain-containing protein [Pedobacter insulae]SFH26176.1 Protein of unknown function [Pedobacter insulae]
MKQLAYTLLICVLFSACKKDKTSDIQPVDLAVKVSYSLETSSYTLPQKDIKIQLKNVNTGTVQILNTDETGAITFKSIAAGTYDIDATITIAAAVYTQLTGIETNSDITFNAASKNTQITVGFTGGIELKLVSGTISDWVIKQIYFAGSHRQNGATYRDQFIEFYNNSDQTLYADGLYFAEITGVITSGASYYLLPSEQMDWSKSVNMPTNIDANKDYVYARALLMIPGTGKQYPVLPGKSIVVAQTAINHKQPFTGTDGEAVSVLDPSLTVDLSGADFEAYYAPFLTKPLSSDVDTAVPNLEALAYFGTDMIFDNNGRYSYILFKASADVVVKDLPQYHYPTKSVPTSTSKKYYQIPNNLILDAVEVQANLPDDRNPKKLNPALDAGFAFVPAGSYTSQSVIRKTEKTINGRIILKDTNNSTEDFSFFNIATPRGFKQ